VRTVVQSGVLALLLALSACSSEEQKDPYQQQLADARISAARKVEQQDKQWNASKGPAPYGAEACAASLAVLMSEDPRTMKRWRIQANKFGVRYRRDDGTNWEYRCNATPNRLRWHSFENGREGRERADDNVRYKVAQNVLTLTISGIDGADYDYTFSLPSLRQLPKVCDVPATCGTPHSG
jgi:hypothetical protein